MPPYAVVATSPTPRGSTHCLASLLRAGYRRDEISHLATAPTGARRPGWAAVGWLAETGAVIARGPLADAIRAAGGISAGLAACGLADYTAHRCVATLAAGGTVTMVHTTNGFETAPLVELLSAHGAATSAVRPGDAPRRTA